LSATDNPLLEDIPLDDRWFKQRRVETIRFTGSQVFKDAQGCVSELLNVLRGASARP